MTTTERDEHRTKRNLDRTKATDTKSKSRGKRTRRGRQRKQERREGEGKRKEKTLTQLDFNKDKKKVAPETRKGQWKKSRHRIRDLKLRHRLGNS